MKQTKNWHEKHKDELSFGDRIADAVANGMGSWSFIIIQTILVAIWMILNMIGFIYHWDVYPFILLNLVLQILQQMTHYDFLKNFIIIMLTTMARQKLVMA